MKIKQKNFVRLDELMKYVWDNGIKGKTFKSSRGNIISITSKGNVDFSYQVLLISPDELFAIEEEIDITEESTLNVTVVFSEHIGNKNYSTSIYDVSINELKGNEKIKFIYIQNEDGSIGDLIWSKERGLID